MKEITLQIPEGKKAEWINGVLTLVDEKKQDITECIKTFEDACYEIGFDHPFVNAYYDCIVSNHSKSMNDHDLVAYLKLRIITAALNEGWEPQFTKDEYRWYSYHRLITKEQYEELSDDEKRYVVYRDSSTINTYYGFVYSHTYCVSSGYDSYVSSQLAFKNEKLADYAGKQFAEIYAAFCFKPKGK